MLYLFKVRKLGPFLPHGRQYRRMGLVDFATLSQCCIRARDRHKHREITFFFHRMPDSSIVFECNIKSDSGKGIVFNRIPFFNDYRPEFRGPVKH